MTTEPTAKHKEEARELLPCPFCGKPAKFEDGGFNAIRVACSDFDCEQRRRVHKRDRNCHEKLAAHWNMRTDLASPSDAEELIELRKVAVEARDVLALLVPYGKIHTVEGVKYPDGSHSEAVDRGERVLNQIRAALAPKQEGKEPK